MPQTPVDNTEASLALTQAFVTIGVFPPHDGGAGGAFLDEIFTFAFNFAPGGTLGANGQLLSINQNQAVFSIIGTTYGGNGTTNFAIPNLGGVTMIGTGQGPGLSPEQLGVPDGTSSVTLTLPELPPDLGGTSQPFSNYQPSLPVTYMICVEGIFPSQGGTGALQDMIGEVMPFAGNFVPTDYLPADGRLLSIHQNLALFALIGTTYGGDGVTTFALPDLRDRTIIGASTADPLGTLIGSPTVSLSNSQTPNSFSNTVQPFDNREPSLALNYLIALSGLFPVRDGGGGVNPNTPYLGEVMPFAGTFAPSGWALANGQLLPINQNLALFALIGTTYGGDGITTFALPDLRNRTVVGTGTSVTIGSQLGANFTTVTAAELPLPPALSVTSIASATKGQVFNLSSLVTIADPDNVGYQQLELWDSNGTLAGGHFAVNGVAQTAGHEIDVSPAIVANTVFDAGTSAGTDTLWARLLQDDGTLTSWMPFTVTVPTPTLSVTSIASATKGQVFNLSSSLVTIADPGNVSYQQLELWDTAGTVAGGHFMVNGVFETGGFEIDVSPANVANTVFDAGTSAGTDTLWARLLQDDGTLTSWMPFTVTVPTPTLSVTSIASATKGQVFNLSSSLVTIADPGNVSYQQLELWDTAGTVAGGHFMVNGVFETGGFEIDVSPANVANTVFDAGTSAGTDTLWARLLQDNGTLTSWMPFTVTVPTPTLRVTSIASATKGQVFNLSSSLVTIADPGNVSYQQLELWDTAGTVAGGHFVVNGGFETGGFEIDVSPANVANTVFDAGTSAGTDTLWARLLQDNGTLTSWMPFTVTVPTPTLSVTSIASATKGQVINLSSSLVTIADPGNVGYQQLELWDSIGTVAGGHFVVNGVFETGGFEIDVSPANVANTVFDAGTSAGTDMLWARLLQDNGTLTSWMQFTVKVPTPTLSVNNFSGATPSQVINLSSLVTISDPANVGYQQLELWDTNGAAATGQFVVNGIAQTGGHETDVLPANVANTVFDVGSTGATDTLWARLLQDNGTLTPWQQFTVKDPKTIAPDGTVDLASAYAGAVTFAGSTGTLQLDNSSSFTGTVAGMTGQDTIDFVDVDLTKVRTPSFSGTSIGGTLTVTDGSHTANIALLGNYLASTFIASSDGHGGTNVIDSAVAASTNSLSLGPAHA